MAAIVGIFSYQQHRVTKGVKAFWAPEGSGLIEPLPMHIKALETTKLVGGK